MITITTCHYLESTHQGKVMEGTELGNRPWKEEDDSVTVSDTPAMCETNNCNDLLYMYTTKDMVKEENNLQKGNLASQNKTLNKPWKQYSQYRSTTHITDISPPKEALIRLKCKEELFDTPEIRGLQIDADMKEMTKAMNNQVIVSPSTLSPPSTSTPGVQRGVSTIMWIHLQASICTEWAQEQLVLKHGARQTALDQVGNGDNRKKSTFQQELDCLHAMQTSSNRPGIIKAPRTIHRCILKTSSNGKNQNNGGLECHVCNTSYGNYNSYFTHLIDSTCIKKQEAKRIDSTRMTIYDTQIETRKATQPTVYSPRKFWTSESIPGSNRIWKNYTRIINLDSGTADTTKRQQKADKSVSKPVSISIENGKKSSIIIESDSDQEVQIISEQMMKANNEPTHKKIRLSADKGSEHEKIEHSQTNKREDENVQNEVGIHNKTVSNFDEQAASETLLLLSSSSSHKEDGSLATDDKEINQDIAEPEAASSSSTLFSLPVLCPCEAARRLGNISMEENEEDEESFVDFTAKLGAVLTEVLGESRLSQLGYPGLSGRELLEKVLRLTGTTVTREDDLCSLDCKVRTGLRCSRKFLTSGPGRK